MPLSYEPTLLLLSVAFAILGSYISLRIALQIKGAHGFQRRWLLMAAAFTLAIAVWGMHFEGLLAGRLPFTLNYLVLPTILSFLVCVLAGGAAFVSVNIEPRTSITLGVAAIAMGCGIATLHFIGMWAIRDSVTIAYQPVMVVVSIGIGIFGSAAALWISFYALRRPPLFVCAIVLGLAMAGMHYTAIAGAGFSPAAISSILGSPAVSPDLLAIIVTLVGFVMSGTFLLTLVPEHPKSDLAFAPGQRHPRYGRRSTDRPLEELISSMQTIAESEGLPESRTRRSTDVAPSEAAGPKVEAQRKIAAIMAADVAFFTTLVANDEEETLRLLSVYRSVFENFVTNYRGRVFNTAGDSLMSEFSSAVQAMRAAIEIQDRLRTLNQSRSPDRRLQFRIGITIADVVERQGELYGEGVNLAARLESLAPPGGICVSRAVHESVVNKVSVGFRDLGQQTLKNIRIPIHAFIVDWPNPGGEPA
ncbi:MHYT domain-containing protein [Methylocapsa palsarum]|uniref:MHYT domain-containing protein, NO-binding membrane sensor n=1 Tax=Methylocapsa palsarum TaxID=1612308 RepID=A0A1I4C167_9HYPH|nr:MHYT domain-containing protein, NO-binding membrane sensor [Methylocapsa palsarum]